ncbi:sensor histidine kinase [Vibrio cincinnatiensis]|uniref:sensor histidine kinase n=1 Tax=Vibrio cincinnatiensis TaxID=675 RepID=UPI001EDD3168|nr:sensor histidine kinase [Vibrio cincinnatiensis]MCG3766330.1 sensor histidine kinase [Vibrio cincinnatiensis]
MELVLSLLQQMCVYFVLAYMLSKTPLFLPILNISSHFTHKLSVYVLFSLFCILGTYLGLQINDAIANTRAIGAVMGGVFGGPVVGFAVGLTGGLHRFTLGGFTDLACAISTTAEGLIGGLFHTYMIKQGKRQQLFNTRTVFTITLIAEVVQMLLILLIAKPFTEAYELVSAIAISMIIANALGAALFMSILQDKKTIFEEYSATFSRRALNIAERSVGILAAGFNPSNAEKIARIVYEQTNVGAVSITDREKILAFVGIGDDHHKPNTAISSQSTLDAIARNDIIYLDGKEHPYQCSLSSTCKLGSALIIPLRAGDRVIGTIKLYEPKRKLFSTINMSMAQGIAQLLSSQILYGEYQEKQILLSRAEIKLLQAQVNPHFLFNALNTISAVIRRDPAKARELIQHLSQFFRSNLKQNIGTVTLKEELAHVNAYLTIEKARFSDRLDVEIDINEGLFERNVPSFTLQPLVENAIKHGTSNLLEGGKVRIYSVEEAKGSRIIVEDNAGSYQTPKQDHDGLGMQIVAKRLTYKFGNASSLNVDVEPNQYTRMSFLIPQKGSY